MEDAKRVWRQVFSSFAPDTALRHGLLGDGEGNVVVTGKPGWSWIRYREDIHRLSIVRNHASGMADGTPVLVGKRHHSDDYEQVLLVHWGPYSWDPTQATIDQYTTDAHGPTHLGKANDPAPIDYNNLAPGKVVAEATPSLNVAVQDFVYANNLDAYEWTQDTLDLTAYVPAIAGHRYVLVHMDLDSDSLGVVAGDIVAAGTDPDIPAPELNTIPLAIVELANGDTAITNDYIWQYKLLYDSIGGDVPPHTHSSATDGGSSILGLEELMLACWQDILIQAGQITPVQAYHRLIAPEGMYWSEGVVDVDLHTINADGVYGCGQFLVLRGVASPLYAEYQVTLRHNIGNIWLSGEEDVTLRDRDHIVLVYDGSYWNDLPGASALNQIDDLNIRWEDLRIPLERGRPAGGSQPEWANILGGLYAWQFTDGEEIFFTVQMPHTWKEGSIIYPHLHWMPTSDVSPADNIGIGLEYAWISIGEDLPGAATTITRDVSTGVNTSGQHLVHDFATGGIDGTGQTISSVLVCRFFRQAAAEDNYAAAIWGLEVDFHYQVDSQGSRQIYTK